MLLTRSPLGLHQCCHWMDLVRLACVRHAASVRPEPGSNSPSRSPTPRRTGERDLEKPVGHVLGRETVRDARYKVDVTTGTSSRWDESPALAFFVLSSVVKEPQLAEHTPEGGGARHSHRALAHSAAAFRRRRETLSDRPGASTSAGEKFPRDGTCERPLRQQEVPAVEQVRPLDQRRRSATLAAVGRTPPWASAAPGVALRRGQTGADQQLDQRRSRSPGWHACSTGPPPPRPPAPRATPSSGRRRTAPRRRPRPRRPPPAPWTSSVSSSGQHPLGQPPLGRRRRARPAARRSRRRAAGEVQQVAPRPGSSSVWTQNWRNWYGLVGRGRARRAPPAVLPNLAPSALVSSGQVRPWAAPPSGAADEVDAGGDVAPLVGAAHLQLDVVVLVQPPEVVGLEQHVAELGVGDARGSPPSGPAPTPWPPSG